jgi:hypothetical protein
MNATSGRGWLLVLAGLLPCGSVHSQDSTPPALLPPSTFAARIAARRLLPMEPEAFAPSDRQPAKIAPAPAAAVSHSVSPSVSLQPAYESAMRSMAPSRIPLGEFRRCESVNDENVFSRGCFDPAGGPALQRLDLSTAMDAATDWLTFPSMAVERPKAGDVDVAPDGRLWPDPLEGRPTASSPSDWLDSESDLDGDQAEWMNPFALEAETSVKTEPYFSDLRKAIKSASSCSESCLSRPAGMTETVLGF